MNRSFNWINFKRKSTCNTGFPDRKWIQLHANYRHTNCPQSIDKCFSNYSMNKFHIRRFILIRCQLSTWHRCQLPAQHAPTHPYSDESEIHWWKLIKLIGSLVFRWWFHANSRDTDIYYIHTNNCFMENYLRIFSSLLYLIFCPTPNTYLNSNRKTIELSFCDRLESNDDVIIIQLCERTLLNNQITFFRRLTQHISYKERHRKPQTSNSTLRFQHSDFRFIFVLQNNAHTSLSSLL